MAMAGRATQKRMTLTFEAVTPKHWADFENLFGPRGACAGCWCMWWRIRSSQFKQQKGEGNRQAIKALVAAGVRPGILAFHNGQAIGWCALAPRADYVRLERSRVLKPIDDLPVWSITCFFVARAYRGQGVTGQLLKAALAHARKQGAKIVEAYPIEPRKGRMADVFVYTGLASTFRKAGFVECARRSETRPIMRYQF
jgi:GNAT superfamily N-acetyltransferase